MDVNNLKHIDARHLIKAKHADWKTNANHTEDIIGLYYINPNQPQNPKLQLFKETENQTIVLTETIDIEPETIRRCTGYRDLNNTYVWEGDTIETFNEIKGHIINQNGTYAVNIHNNKNTITDDMEEEIITIPMSQLFGVFIVIKPEPACNQQTADQIYNEILSIVNSSTQTAPEKLNLIKDKLITSEKPNFDDMPCKIGDRRFMIPNTQNIPTQLMISHYGVAVQCCVVEHFYVDENGNKKILLKTASGDSIIFTPEQLKQNTFKNMHDLKYYVENHR